MINITNKPVDEINKLIQKYMPLFELMKPNEHIPHLAYTFELGIKYIKEKHNNINIVWKQWIIIYLKHKLLKNEINTDNDIIKHIDDLIYHFEHNHNQYINTLAIYSNDYDRDCDFVHDFINKTEILQLS